MTDADDAGLINALNSFDAAWDTYVRKLRNGSHHSICLEAYGCIAPARERVARAAEAQAKEIEELRREKDIANEAWKGTRCAELREQSRAEKAEAALAEALNIMHDVRDICTFDVTMEGPKYTGTNASACIRAYKVASAFLAKHGERSDAA